MNIYTVSFFGHRETDLTSEIEDHLDKLLHDIISKKEYVEFLIGRNGEFDLIMSSIIKRAINKYSCGNTSFILVLPYLNAEYRDNKKSYLDYYDEVEICHESAVAYYKAAIQIRNKFMVDRSDLVIFYVKHNNGGAYSTMQYAAKQKKQIINIYDSLIFK